MAKASRYLGQALLYALFFLPIAWLTHQPTHTHLEPGMAELKIAVRHAGKIIGQCGTDNSAPEVLLPEHVTRPEICPRERSPLQLELLLDGETLYRATVAPSGLHNDGVSSMYRRFRVPAGRHHLALRMNDDAAREGATWELVAPIELAPAQVLVATFKEGFRLQ